MVNIYDTNLFQILILMILIIIFTLLMRQIRSFELEKRIGKYSVENANDKHLNITDSIINRYFSYIYRMRDAFSKHKIFTDIASRYEKDIELLSINNVLPIDYVIHKIVIATFSALFIIIVTILKSDPLSIMNIILAFLIGYFILDIILIYIKCMRHKKIENELLKAVIVMNNAFKGGKSIIQAVEIASNELPEPINMEFKRIYNDIKYGLAVETAFERFAKRVNTEGAEYLSSSLTMLSKTGGNIVKVFTSIEKSLFDKKKMKDELKNLTMSSNLVVKILFILPCVFILIIYLLNPTYFNPLFESPLGLFIIFLIIALFILYIYFLQKIVKVRI